MHADEVPDSLEVLGVAKDAHGPDATPRRRTQSNTGHWVNLRLMGPPVAEVGYIASGLNLIGAPERSSSSRRRQ
jgi:hypothetical protein